jgi:hypothetical protein
VRTTPAQVHASDGDDPAIEERITTIIRENASDKRLSSNAPKGAATRTDAVAAVDPKPIVAAP